MNLLNKNRFALLGIALLCVAASGPAATLGRAKGSVIFGEPLKLMVPIRLEAGEGLPAMCFDAEVFYGDTRQDPQWVTVRSEYPPQTQLTHVYVTSTSRVNEPVVSVYFHAGCEVKTTRRFVLLADLTVGTAKGVAQASGVMQSEMAVPIAQVRPTPDDRVAAQPQTRERSLPAQDLAPASTVRLQTTLTQGPARSRLKLLNIELTQDRDPPLKFSNDLYLGDGQSPEKRAEAAAIWKSLNATPQDILDTYLRRQSLEANLKGLQVDTAKNSKTLLDLAGRLQSAESQRYANPLVYALVALLLLSTLGLIIVLFTRKQGGFTTLPWWRADAVSDKTKRSTPRDNEEDIDAGTHLYQATAMDGKQPVVTAPPVIRTVPVTEVDIDLQLDELAMPDELKTDRAAPVRTPSPPVDSESRATGHVDFANSVMSSLRSVNTQEMLDVRQQADFFMTLGQHDEALGLLKDCVDGSLDSNPLVFLDLLKVLHTLGRKAEFDHYRTDFNALFSGRVPVFAGFTQGGDGLDAYPEICQNIEALWPSEQAVDYIERRLVRDAGDGITQTMDLEAFRELLMLHGTAKRIASSSESGLMPFITSKMSHAEVGALYERGLGDFNLPESTNPVMMNDFSVGGTAVDIDLPTPADNLIDFDAADLSLPGPRPVRKS